MPRVLYEQAGHLEFFMEHGAFSDDGGERGTGVYVGGWIGDDREVIGQIDVFLSTASLNEYIDQEDSIRVKGIGRGKVGFLGGIEVPSSIRRMGIGKLVVEDMLQECLRIGVTKVVLLSVPNATRFWEKMGAVRVDYDDAAGFSYVTTMIIHID